jgi:hypothetical protein
MKVREAVALLLQQDQDATLVVAVGWAADTAYSDDGDALTTHVRDGRVILEGWLSNCGTELEIQDENEDET